MVAAVAAAARSGRTGRTGPSATGPWSSPPPPRRESRSGSGRRRCTGRPTADLFGEQQLVLLCGKDTAIVLEHHRRTWRWAEEHGLVAAPADRGGGDRGARRVPVRHPGQGHGLRLRRGLRHRGRGLRGDRVTVVDDGWSRACWSGAPADCTWSPRPTAERTPLMRRRITAASANGYEDTTTLLMVWAAPAEAPETRRQLEGRVPALVAERRDVHGHQVRAGAARHRRAGPPMTRTRWPRSPAST